MVASRKDTQSSKSRQPPAKTPEARERQLVGMAYDLAEKQMREGTASAQVITHFLKSGSGRDKLEREKIKRENLLLSSRVDEIASSARMEELYSRAISAMREYGGGAPEAEDEF